MITGTHYLRAREIARFLGVSERTIRRWITAKELPSVKIGGARLVAREDLEHLLTPQSQLTEDDANEKG